MMPESEHIAPKHTAVPTPKEITKKKKPTRLLLHLVLVLVFLTIVSIAALYGLNTYTLHGQVIRVPKLIGLSSIQANQLLENAELNCEIDDSVYVKDVPAGSICDQSISAGMKVKKGRTIHLTVSSGKAPKLVMPDIADNSSLREATMKLTALGFKLGPVEYMHGEKDWVYEVKTKGKNLNVGSAVELDDEITLVVGDGTYYDEFLDDFEDGTMLDNQTPTAQ